MKIKLLIDSLAKDKKIESLLNETTAPNTTDLIDLLRKEFEAIVERYRDLSVQAAHTRQMPELVLPTNKISERQTALPEREPASKRPLHISPIKLELPPINIEGIREQAKKKTSEAHRLHLFRDLESIERQLQLEIQRDWDNNAKEIHDRILMLKSLQHSVDHPRKIPSVKIVVAAPMKSQRIREEVTDSDLFYLHALLLPSSDEVLPSLSTIKGIDNKNHLFVSDTDGYRLVLSRIVGEFLTVTTSGAILLSKQQSHQLRSRHEEVINALRLQAASVPFEFGSVVRGRKMLEELVHRFKVQWNESLAQEAASTTWSVKAYALDARVTKYAAQLLPMIRTRERGRPQKSKRFDIRLFEKMLNTEKDIAVTVYKTLAARAARSAAVFMIDHSSGTSSDWKLILHAEYELSPTERAKLFSAIRELESTYRKVGLMLCVEGSGGRALANDDQNT